jgi:glycosyltransferase involved in cell wall biosynthesis
LQVALVVPCFNEEATIASVLTDFRSAVAGIDLFVFDNNSTDRTAQVALEFGATVVAVKLQGKGNVVRRMFSDVEADIYVMVDGDGTYHADSLPVLLDMLIDQRLDMVVGTRSTPPDDVGDAFRSGHRWGNVLLTRMVAQLFGGQFSDMLSGYRVFSRRYAKSFPALARGFETETELTVHALELRMPCGEVPTPYGARPEGSVSKLSTYGDGFKILRAIARLFITERPFAFFGSWGVGLGAISIVLALPVLAEFTRTGLVPRFPTAVLSACLMICALTAFMSGLILEKVTLSRQEFKRLAYLGIPALVPHPMGAPADVGYTGTAFPHLQDAPAPHVREAA